MSQDFNFDVRQEIAR
jgi:hypothetical protein